MEDEQQEGSPLIFDVEDGLPKSPRPHGGARNNSGRKRKRDDEEEAAAGEGESYAEKVRKRLPQARKVLENMRATQKLKSFSKGYFDLTVLQAIIVKAYEVENTTFLQVQLTVVNYFNEYWCYVDGKKPCYWGKVKEPFLPVAGVDNVDLVNQGRRSEMEGFVFKDGGFEPRSVDAFSTALHGISIAGPPNCRDVEVSQIYYKSLAKRRLAGVDMVPHDVDQPPTSNPFRKVDMGQQYLNLWSGFEFTDEEAAEAYVNHFDLFNDFCKFVHDVTCSGNTIHYRYFMDWFAYKVQHPGAKLDTAIVLYSGQQRQGKGLVFENFVKIFSPNHATQVKDMGNITNKFNAWMEPMVLIWGDEIQFAGNHADAQKLKSIQTEETLNIEGKGLELRTVKNHIALIYSTNHAHMVSADMNDKRHFILEIAPDQDNTAWMTHLRRGMDRGGRAALFHYLRRVHKVSLSFGTRGTDAPVTELMRLQKEKTAKDTHTFWLECLRRGYVVRNPRKWVAPGLNNPLLEQSEPGYRNWVHYMVAEEVQEAYVHFKRSKGSYKYDAPLAEVINAGSLLLGLTRKGQRPFQSRTCDFGQEAMHHDFTVTEAMEEYVYLPHYEECLKTFNDKTGMDVWSKYKSRLLDRFDIDKRPYVPMVMKRLAQPPAIGPDSPDWLDMVLTPD